MTDEIARMLQEIGSIALTLAGVANPETLLLYCQVEEGAMSTDLFFRTTTEGTVFHILGPDELDDPILAFWDAWKATPGNNEWRVMSYSIQSGKFHLGLEYPDQLDPNEHLRERRPRALIKAFGTEAAVRR